MAVTNFSLIPLTTPTSVNLTTAGSQRPTDAVLLANGNALSVYIDFGATGNVYLRQITPAGVPTGPEVKVNSVAGIDQGGFFDHSAQAARLANGSIVVTWADSGAVPAVHYRLFDTNLNPLSTVMNITFGAGKPRHAPDVAALTNGGFVISFERDVGGTEFDVYAQRFDSVGNQVGAIVTVNATPGLGDYVPSVAVLTDGGFAIAHQRDNSATLGIEQWRSVWNADGSNRIPDAQFDATGTINIGADVLALSGGGFLVSYSDNGWTANARDDITSAAFSAAGSLANYARDTNAPGVINASAAKSALSPDGYVFVSNYQVAVFPHTFGALLSPDGRTVLGSQLTVDAGVGSQYFPAPVWLDRTRILVTELVDNGAVGSDSDMSGVAALIVKVYRTAVGTNAAETLNYTADAFDTTITEGSGNNTIYAGVGAYNIITNGGDNTIIGGAGRSEERRVGKEC